MAIVSTKRTLFAEIGVPEGADAETCRRAWRDRVRSIHPDLVSDPAERAKRTTQISRLNAAKDTLVDPTRRAVYLADIEQARRRATSPRPADRPSGPTSHAAPPAATRPGGAPARTVPPVHTDGVRARPATAAPGVGTDAFSAERLAAYLTRDAGGRWIGVGAALVLGMILRNWSSTGGGLEILFGPVVLLTIYQAIEARSPIDIPAATLLRLVLRGGRSAARLLREAFR